MTTLFSKPRAGGWTRLAAAVTVPLVALGVTALWSPSTAAPGHPQGATLNSTHGSTVETAQPGSRMAAGLRTAAQHAGVLPAGWAKGHQTAALSAPDGSQGANFGGSVAISPDGKTAVIGAFNRNLHTGAAYVFVRHNKTWKQAQELTAADGAQYDYYGYSVAVSSGGSTVLVGAYGHNGTTGDVYAYTRQGKQWTQTAEFTAADSVAGDAFGYFIELSADGSTAMIGAPDRAQDTGAVYAFADSGGTWTQTAELTASDGGSNDQFGYTIAVSADGSTAVIGSPDNNDLVGVAYVFTMRKGAWKQTAELTASDGASFDEFGYSVAVSENGSTAVIGGYGHSTYTGSAYVFTRSGKQWAQTAELAASDAAEYDDFGYSVGVTANGSTAIVGASGDNDLVGAVYVFHSKAGQWAQKSELSLSDGQSLDEFGYSTAITPDGSTLLIGAYGRSSGVGAAYVYKK